MLVGKGAFARVYQTSPGRARKRTPAKDTYGVALHRQEVRVLRRLNALDPDGDFVVRAFSDGAARGDVYLDLEYLPKTLYHWWAERPDDPAALARALRQVCLALDFLQQSGVCHMDVKADNVMVRGDGRFVLVDFGRSVFTNDAQKVTRNEWAAPNDPPSGAYCLMPEEVLSLLQQYTAGEPVTVALTNKVDVYALGATAYHLWVRAHHDGTYPSELASVGPLLERKRAGKAWLRAEGFLTLPKTLRTLVRMMLHIRPEYRISARVAAKYCDMFLETAEQNVAQG